MHKRAQFFIIAALVVSSIILGTSGIRNQAREEIVETATIDLSQELAYEAHQVLDNGVFAGQNADEIQGQMEQLVEAYGASNPDSDIQILFGDPESEEGLQQIRYDTSQGSKVTEVDTSAGITIADSATDAEETPTTGSAAPVENEGAETRKKLKVKIKLPREQRQGDEQIEEAEERVIERDLALTPGQNVYVIVKKKIRNDQTLIIQP